MNEINSISEAVELAHNAISALNDAIKWISKSCLEVSADEPTSREKAAISHEEVRAILSEKCMKGYTSEIRKLLKKYGASKLSEVDSKNYEDMIKDAEMLDDKATD